MRPARGGDWRSGFNLLETVVVLAILGMVIAVGIPRALDSAHRSRFEGFLHQAQALLHRAKLDAARSGAPVAVWVEVDAGPPRVVASSDLPPLVVPAGLAVAGPRGPGDAFDGLTGIDPGAARRSRELARGDARAVVFRGDGSVYDAGAFRFADDSGNFLELRVAPEATARVAIRKYDPDPELAANPIDDSRWYERGEGGRSWRWN